MKVLIADDEVYMLEYLKKLVDWESYGFSQVLTASGGSLARDILDKHQPQLLITDIRMPRVSGLDLCRHIDEKGYATKVIILSGYGEFEYAKQAIHYGVSEYLVKPILQESFAQALERVIVQNFARERRQQEEDKDNVVSYIKEYIREHVSEELSLEQLAGLVYLNSSYLSRYFKEVTGENLSGYISRCRMEKAALLLEQTDKKVNEVMMLLGYKKAQYFAKLFREQYGVSPKDYKRGKRRKEELSADESL